MKLEDQVCSLELAKRLKELGCKQESLFHWRRWIPIKGSTYRESDCEWVISLYASTSNDYEYLPAYSVAELGEMLPWRIIIDGQYYWLNMCIDREVFYKCDQKDVEEIWSPDSSMEETMTEANSRADMLIWLIENGHVKLPNPPEAEVSK